MSKNTQLLVTLIILGLVDAVIPLFPIVSLILIYVVLQKPPWFLETVRQVYNTR